MPGLVPGIHVVKRPVDFRASTYLSVSASAKAACHRNLAGSLRSSCCHAGVFFEPALDKAQCIRKLLQQLSRDDRGGLDMRAICTLALVSLVFVPCVAAKAFAADCGARNKLNQDIQALNVKIQVRSGEAGGVDTPEVCHLTKWQESLFMRLKSIVEASPTHCGLDDFKLQKLQAVNYDRSRSSCGANWK